MSQNNKTKFNICIISSYYYRDENCTGLSSYYFNLANSLANLGNIIFLITLDDNLLLKNRSNLSFIKVKQPNFFQNGIGVSLKGLSRIWARFLFSLKAFFEVKKLILSEGVDFVIAPELFAQGFFVSLFKKKKLITILHSPTYMADRYNERYKHHSIGDLLSFPEKIQAKRSHACLTASQYLKRIICRDWKIDKDKITLMPTSVQINWIKETSSLQGQVLDGDYLLYFGRLEKRKGMLVLADALNNIFAKYPDLKVVFAGKDWGMKELIIAKNRGYIRNLKFFDTLQKDKLFALIKYAKLIVLPSLSENFPNAALESMALAKPVIGTRETGFEEIITDGYDGFLVKPGDTLDLRDKILECLSRKDLHEIGEKACRSVQRFDISRVGVQFVEFLNSLAVKT